jgi:hypothetical protein
LFCSFPREHVGRSILDDARATLAADRPEAAEDLPGAEAE